MSIGSRVESLRPVSFPRVATFVKAFRGFAVGRSIWDGPTDPDPAKQNEVIDTWITRGVDVIAVAVENRDGISSVLRNQPVKPTPRLPMPIPAPRRGHNLCSCR